MKDKLFTEAQVKKLHDILTGEKMQSFLSSVKEAPEGAVHFEIVVTSEDTDRVGDIIRMAGLDIKNYLLNPVVLPFHNYDALPVGITTELTLKGKQYIAKGYFAPAEANPEAEYFAKMYQLGLLRTASIGFIPKAFDPKDKSIITEAELLEWSFTPVPANPFALSVMKQAELDVATVKKLGLVEVKDEDEEEVETKGDVEDTLNEQEKREKKYANMKQVWDIMYAFSEVYFAEDKEVDDFKELLKETAGLLQGIADGATIEEKGIFASVKELNEEKREAINTALGLITEEKAGRVLSDKNVNLIKDAVSGLKGVGEQSKGVVKMLEALLASADTAKGEDTEEKGITHKQSGNDQEVFELQLSQTLLRDIAKAVQGGLTKVNSELKKKKAE